MSSSLRPMFSRSWRGERVLPEIHEYEWGASTPAASLSESGIDVQVDHPETDEEDDIRGHCGAGEARIVVGLGRLLHSG